MAESTEVNTRQVKEELKTEAPTKCHKTYNTSTKIYKGKQGLSNSCSVALWLHANYIEVADQCVKKVSVWKALLRHLQDEGLAGSGQQHLTRQAGFLITLKNIFPHVQVQRKNGVSFYHNLQAREKGDLYLKPQPLCWELLQGVHPSMSSYGWTPLPLAEHESNVQLVSWTMPTGFVSQSAVSRTLTVNSDLTWTLAVGAQPVIDLDLGVSLQLRNILDLDNLLFICSRLPLCHGFSVGEVFESLDVKGHVLGRTERWNKADCGQRELIHRSTQCAVVCRLSSHKVTCLNCEAVRKMMTHGGDRYPPPSQPKKLPLKKRGRKPKPKAQVTTVPATLTLHKKYKCFKCRYSTNRATHFRSHIACHVATREFACDQCVYRAFTPSVLARHKLRHTDERPFHCHLCDFTTKHQTSLKLHMKRHSDERPLKCLHCDFATKHCNSLTQHLLRHSDDKPLTCQQCSFRTKHALSLKLHMRTHAGYRPYKCDKCDFVAICRSNLNQHVRTHSNERAYKCQECEASYKSSTALKIHYRTHLGIKPYVCRVCNKAFGQQGNMKRHYLMHTNVKQAYCEICDKHFSLIDNLKRHNKSVHSEVIMHVNCNICHKSLSSAASLSRHMSTVHHKERKYSCHVCQRAYSVNVTLQRHLKTHAASELKEAEVFEAEAAARIKQEPMSNNIEVPISKQKKNHVNIDDNHQGLHIIGASSVNNRSLAILNAGVSSSASQSRTEMPMQLLELKGNTDARIVPRKRGRPRKAPKTLKQKRLAEKDGTISAIVSKLLVHAQEFKQCKRGSKKGIAGRQKIVTKKRDRSARNQMGPTGTPNPAYPLAEATQASTLSHTTLTDSSPVAPVVKRRGRPPNSFYSSSSSATIPLVKLTDVLADKQEEKSRKITQSKTPKKRGRPQKKITVKEPKHRDTVDLEQNVGHWTSASTSIPVLTTKPPRKRGRPKKNVTVQLANEAKARSSNVIKNEDGIFLQYNERSAFQSSPLLTKPPRKSAHPKKLLQGLPSSPDNSSRIAVMGSQRMECLAQSQQHAATVPASRLAEPPRKRGRPRKAAMFDLKSNFDKTTTLFRDSPADQDKSAHTAEQSPPISASLCAKSTRKRGRPKKFQEVSDAQPTLDKPAKLAKTKQRGRPKKSQTRQVTKMGKKRGRPPKSQLELDLPCDLATPLRALAEKVENSETGDLTVPVEEDGPKDLIVVVQGTTGGLSDLRFVSAVSLEGDQQIVPMETQHVIIESRPLDTDTEAVIYVHSDQEVVAMTAGSQLQVARDAELPFVVKTESLAAISNQHQHQQQQHPLAMELSASENNAITGTLLTGNSDTWSQIPSTAPPSSYVLQSEGLPVTSTPLPQTEQDDEVNTQPIYIEIESMEQIEEGRQQPDNTYIVNTGYALDSQPL